MRTRILLVDDDATLLRFLGEYLLSHGFAVTPASSGAEALRQAYSLHPDLVVLDVMMPGMDGWEVCARLREMSDIPIILVTGKTAEEDKLRGFQLGVDDYVTKPFSFVELTARITAVLNRARAHNPAAPHRLRFAGITLDLDRREASRAGGRIPLTPTEYRLLEALALRQGQAVSEEDLLQEVWGARLPHDTSLIRRCIWLLRRKIEPDPPHPQVILSVRGFGYRLAADFDPAQPENV